MSSGWFMVWEELSVGDRDGQTKVPCFCNDMRSPGATKSAEKLGREAPSMALVTWHMLVPPFPTLPGPLFVVNASRTSDPGSRKPLVGTPPIPGIVGLNCDWKGVGIKLFSPLAGVLPNRPRWVCEESGKPLSERIHSAMASGDSSARMRSWTTSHWSGLLSTSAWITASPCRCSALSLSISDRRWSLVLHFLSS